MCTRVTINIRNIYSIYRYESDTYTYIRDTDQAKP